MSEVDMSITNVLEKLRNSNIEYDLTAGFVWAEFKDEDGKYENIFQLCLNARVNISNEITAQREIMTKKEINRRDNGSGWGMCGDHNPYDPDGIIENEFLKLARKAGFKIIND